MASQATSAPTSAEIEVFVRLVRAGIAVASGAAKGLKRAGFVARENCASDRRVSYAVLTEAGRTKLRESTKSHTRQIRELIGGLYDDDELAQLTALLDRVPGVDPTDGTCEGDS